MERSHKYLNIATVALLAVIAAGFIFMPRYNHGVIVSRVANLSQKLAAVENTVEKLNILDGNGKEEKRSAVIGKIDYIVENLKKANEDQVSFMENISSTASSLEGVIVRLGRLEKVVHAEGHPSHGSLSEEKVLQRVEPVSYSSNQAIGRRLSPNQIAEKDFEGFLDEALEKGWLPSPNGSRAARDQIAEHKIERLKSLFTSFRSAVQAINQCEHLFIEELVEKATKEGDYFEEEAVGPARARVEGPPEPGSTYVKNLDARMRRVFYFPAKDNPEFVRMDQYRQNVMESFLLLLSTVSVP